MMFTPSFQVYGLLDALVTDLLALADELNPQKRMLRSLCVSAPDPCLSCLPGNCLINKSIKDICSYHLPYASVS